MNATGAIARFLETDPRDVGCDEAVELLHVYAELVAADPEVAAQRLPGVAVHLAACGPCHEDLVGLLTALSDDG
ncbi:MAG TPA: hypothetical protein VHW64_01030 [Nocardioides sp.]|jgi:hypothetical protein|uniref:hypothetical protein n=1 Tax=Nocardioides sp. TaxID=35761 RepID=UPI002E36CFC0|nr:hypothetical protein [Nocardioides sp.]HEX3929257.1 hypothetical protein [Nocardioides sp.]